MTELLLIILLLIINGIFAMAEIAIVSAKKARMIKRKKGQRGEAGRRKYHRKFYAAKESLMLGPCIR